MKDSSINRRTFLKVTATGVTAACFSPILAINPKAAKAAQYKSRVALALRNRLVNDSDRIDSKVVRLTIDELLTALTQAANIRDAWLQNREYLIYDGNPPEPDYDAYLEDLEY